MNSWFVKRFRDSSLLHAFALSFFILTCYYGLWNAYFCFDDFWMLGKVRHLASLSDAIWAEFGYSVRLLYDAILWAQVRLFDLAASPYYHVSLLQHFIVTLMVYWLVGFWTRHRTVALFSALLFGTAFSHYTVITLISGSAYSLAAIPYLMTLALFALYLQRHTLPRYLGSLGMFVLTLLLKEFFTLPLVLLAYHLTLGRDSGQVRSLSCRDIGLHLPYWILLAIYLALQVRFIQSGSSEAVMSTQVYGPGLHMIGNLLYLVFLAVPNVHSPPIYSFLTAQSARPLVETIWWLTVALAIAGHSLAVYWFWKGSALVRFALALIYLPFLPYTFWQGSFAGAPRYLYIPSIGFSLLFAFLLVRLHDYLRERGKPGYRLVVPSVVAALLVVNLIVIQVWVQRHVENSTLRRAFVTQLESDYQDIDPEARIYIEVPAGKFIDLRSACRLVFRQPVRCEAFVSGERSLADITGSSSGEPIYWLRVTAEGFRQVYPPVVETQ